MFIIIVPGKFVVYSVNIAVLLSFFTL